MCGGENDQNDAICAYPERAEPGGPGFLWTPPSHPCSALSPLFWCSYRLLHTPLRNNLFQPVPVFQLLWNNGLGGTRWNGLLRTFFPFEHRSNISFWDMRVLHSDCLTVIPIRRLSVGDMGGGSRGFFCRRYGRRMMAFPTPGAACSERAASWSRRCICRQASQDGP
jgi:hypothetical protein